MTRADQALLVDRADTEVPLTPEAESSSGDTHGDSDLLGGTQKTPQTKEQGTKDVGTICPSSVLLSGSKWVGRIARKEEHCKRAKHKERFEFKSELPLRAASTGCWGLSIFRSGSQ